MPVDVGVDAGGSRTIAVAGIGDARNRVETAAANPTSVGMDAAAATIGDAIVAALRSEQPRSIVVGCAGAARSEIAGALRDALQHRFANARIQVIDDARLALYAAEVRERGVVLIAGTGSSAYGENAGRSSRCGGGGYAIGDEGSGYAIGSAGLRLALRALDGRGASDRTVAAVREYTGASDRDGLLAFAYGDASPVSAIAGVAPAILRCADDGERSALTIVQAAARDLFDLVRAVVRAIDAGDETPLVLHGGLLRTPSTLTYLLETRLGNELPQLHTLRAAHSAHEGALRMAGMSLD
jgi:N-acetylglucosamine kinase-like BadF-type ATPase